MTQPDFLVVSTLSPQLGDNSVTLTVTDDGKDTVLQFAGPNGKLDADIAFRKLWSGDIRL